MGAGREKITPGEDATVLSRFISCYENGCSANKSVKRRMVIFWHCKEG